jgi:hypothetical protein
LFEEQDLPKRPPFEFETWFEERWWPQYPLQVEKVAAKKLARATIEGRRGDKAKATPDELLTGVMRYAAEKTGQNPKYIKHPTTWLQKGCWTDNGDHADQNRSDSWAAEQMARKRSAFG